MLPWGEGASLDLALSLLPSVFLLSFSHLMNIYCMLLRYGFIVHTIIHLLNTH